MPEICEVVLTSQALFDKLLNMKLIKINIINGRYKDNPFIGYDLLINTLPLEIINIDTKGKFMWFVLRSANNEISYLLNTFGLAGKWSLYEVLNYNISMEFIDTTTTTTTTATSTTKIYYIDSCSFGTFEYDQSSISLNNKLNKLAPDLLKTTFDSDIFINWIHIFCKKN